MSAVSASIARAPPMNAQFFGMVRAPRSYLAHLRSSIRHTSPIIPAKTQIAATACRLLFFPAKDANMHLHTVAILTAAFVVACGSPDGTSATIDGGGADRESPPTDGSSDSSVADAGPEHDAASADHDAQGDSSACGDGVSCSDCNGRQFCASGSCPKMTCPLTDAGIDTGVARSCASETCGTNQICVHPSCGGGIPILLPERRRGNVPRRIHLHVVLHRAATEHIWLHPAAMHRSPCVLRRRTRLVRRKSHVLLFALERVSGTRSVHIERVTPRGLLQVGVAIVYSSSRRDASARVLSKLKEAHHERSRESPFIDSAAGGSAHLCLWRLGVEPYECERRLSRGRGHGRSGGHRRHGGGHYGNRRHYGDGRHYGDRRRGGVRWCRHDGPGWLGFRIRRRRCKRWRRRDRDFARSRAMYAVMRNRPSLLQRNVRQSCQRPGQLRRLRRSVQRRDSVLRGDLQDDAV